MGAVNFSIDPQLVELLTQRMPFDVFIETGTFRGDTIALVKPYFSKIFSIESSERYYRTAASRFQDDSSITVLRGDSRIVLADLVKQMSDASILFWLDAHWCEDENTIGRSSQCPLLGELRSIHHLNEDSIILIDDARLFLCPPGKPHDYARWPDLNDVLAALNALSDRHGIIIVNDIIVYYPHHIADDLKRFSHERGVDWLEVMVKSREHDALLKEVNAKEEVILDLQTAAEQRLQLIHEQKKELATKDEAIKARDHELVAKEEVIQTQHNELVAKEEVIQMLEAFRHTSLHYWLVYKLPSLLYRSPLRSALRQLLKSWFALKVGMLYQYPPTLLRIPNRYTSEQPPDSPPVISIVTPSYNQSKFLGRTIESVIGQNYPELEYIIQDGASTDGTDLILERYRSQLGQIESCQDKGQAHAINLGFAHATGQIMAWLNSDDLLLPGTLSYVAKFLATHPEVDVVYGHRVLIDENDQEIGRWVLPPHDKKILLWADYVPQETLFWRRRIWEKVGGYVDESFHFAIDWDLLLRFQKAGAKFVRLPRFLSAFRVHSAQKTSAQIDLGHQEMTRLRQRCHGRPVSRAEISQNVRSYKYRSIIYHKLYRLGILRY
jgi:glycosyltransferase involved in cell wall biosynthesis